MGVFGKAILATPSVIGGLSLRAFSAFHAQALLELDSPYIRGGYVSVGDTVAALLVCQSRKADGLSKVIRWQCSLLSRLGWLLYFWRNDHAEISAMLASHIISSIDVPRTWEEVGGGGGCSKTGAAWPFYLVSVVAQEIAGIAYDDIWDMPISELICHKSIIGERAGSLKISENDLEFIERKRGAA